VEFSSQIGHLTSCQKLHGDGVSGGAAYRGSDVTRPILHQVPPLARCFKQIFLMFGPILRCISGQKFQNLTSCADVRCPIFRIYMMSEIARNLGPGRHCISSPDVRKSRFYIMCRCQILDFTSDALNSAWCFNNHFRYLHRCPDIGADIGSLTPRGPLRICPVHPLDLTSRQRVLIN
jgi:hypothetical protein